MIKVIPILIMKLNNHQVKKNKEKYKQKKEREDQSMKGIRKLKSVNQIKIKLIKGKLNQIRRWNKKYENEEKNL